MTTLRSGAATHVGRVRANNQDSALTNDETQLDAEAAKEGAESDDEPAGDGENAGDSEDDQTEDEVESAADSDNE